MNALILKKSWRVLLFGVWILAWNSSGQAANQPNIVYILLDDAGYGDLSCYGQKKFTTPNIDRLAAEGLKFTDHYAGSTVCAPTRCSLMTGKHTGHCLIRGNREVKPEGQAPMPAGTVTLPLLLKKAGYTTGMFGKWGLGAPGSSSDPADHFDTFYGYNCQREAHTYYPKHLWHNREKVVLDGQTYSHHLIQKQALEFIRQHQAGPFFCFMSVTIPHAAMHAPEGAMKPWRERFPEFENVIGKYSGPEVRNPVAAFAAMMTLMDEGVGQVLELLQALGIEGRTLVLLTSDNGPHLEGGHKPWFFDSNGPLRGHKRDLYEGGIRVPLLARWPGTIEPGTTSDLPSAHWDMLPTFCELAGLKAPDGLDGVSLVPTLMGKGSAQKRHDHLYWEYGGRRALRQGDWKIVQFNMGHPKPELRRVELYHLAKDLEEAKNVADEHPDKVRKLVRLMNEAHLSNEAFPLLAREKAKLSNKQNR